MSMCTQVIIHSGMVSLIDDRSVLMFKVCRWGKVPASGAADGGELRPKTLPRWLTVIRSGPRSQAAVFMHQHRSAAKHGGNCAHVR